MHYLFLTIAIISEVIATSLLKATNEFTKLWPSLIVIAGYGCSFFFLTLTLKQIPVGIAYAIWSGLGIVLVSIISFIVYQQKLDTPAIIGISLIISGVVVINIFSKNIGH